MYREVTPENQANARFRLVTSAKMAKYDGTSGLEWMESQEVLNYCKDCELDPIILEHIYQWVWKGINNAR